MRSWSHIISVAAVLFASQRLCTGQIPGDTLLDFEPAAIPGNGAMISSFVQSGIMIKTDASMLHSDYLGSTFLPYNGSAYLNLLLTPPYAVISHVDGNPFALLSVDLAEVNANPRGPTNMIFLGYRTDLTSVTQAIHLDGIIDGIGPEEDFQPFTFDAGFTNLTKVEIRARVAIDNLRLIVQPYNFAPEVRIVSPVTRTSYMTGSDVPLEAEASDSDGEVRQVEFYSENNVLLGSFSNPPYTFIWSNPPAGAHILSARARDDLGRVTVSEPVNILIEDPLETSLVIGFEPPSQPGSTGYIRSWQEQGFIVQTSLSDIWHQDSVTRPGYKGGAYLSYVYSGDFVRFSHAQNRRFTLQSVDIAELGPPFPMPVTFIGHKADESLVSITFMTDGIIEGLPPMAGFERLVFPPEFTDLLRVDITSTSYSLDNLVVKVPSLPPAVRLTGPGEGARFSAGFDVIVGVQATETDNPIVRVQVFAGDNLIGEFSDTACRGLRADGKGH